MEANYSVTFCIKITVCLITLLYPVFSACWDMVKSRHFNRTVLRKQERVLYREPSTA